MSSASSSDQPLTSAGASAGAAVADSAPSKSALKRARNKNKAAAKAAAMQPAAGAARGHEHSHGGGGHSHGAGGGGGHGHSHGHSHGGGGGGGGHAHSHGGVPCGGHGSDGLSLSGGSVSSEDLSEAVHYTDVLWHFQSYATHSFQRLERMHADFASIPTSLQQLVPGFEARMADLRKAVRANHEFLQEIVSHRYVFHSSDDIDYEALEQKVAREHPVDEERMSKVRSTLRQCVRDWSAEGAAERAACYGPILDELERLFPDAAARSGVRVLVPGSGLGRLVWEVANKGFFSAGNEFSYQMLLCSFLILNCCKEKDIFTIFPFVHDSKNLYAPADQLRGVTIPDVNPSQLPPGAQLSMMAGDWMDIFSDLPSDYIHGAYARKVEKERRRQAKFRQAAQKWEARRRDEAKAAAAAAKAGLPAPPAAAPAPLEEEEEEPVPDPVRAPGTTTGPMGEVETKPSNANTWDVFASCYFVDCANNILEFLRTIAYVLKPGGYWINFGPLLYHFSDVPREVSVDLSWEELRRAAPAFGLRLLREQLNQPSAYTSDDRSMLRSQYFCVSCTWQKVGEDQTRRPLALRAPLDEPKSVAWQTRLRHAHDDTWTTVAVAAADAALAHLLTVSGARRVREAAALPSGLAVHVFQLQSSKLGAFLLQACSDRISVAKIVLEDVEMLALLPKQ